MEHLSLPRGAIISDSERAFCIADPYDGGPFLSFPQRSRFNGLYQKLTEHGWPSSSWQVSSTEILELDVFLQTWLFFGLLHEVFGTRAPASKFIDQHFFITTAKLGEIVDEWVPEHKALKDRSDGLRQHLKECIANAWQTSLAVCRTAKVSISILRSIAALCETLEDVVLGTLSSGPRTMTTTWGWLHNFNEIERSMVKNGWCPVDATRWRAAANNFQSVYYLSKLELPVAKDHSKCIGAVCIANQYEDYGIASQHTSECHHRCAALAVDDEKLMSVLANGQVGVLDITIEPASSELIINVVPATEETKYVAISHVWADGLGNPNDNSLPRCQIERITRMVQDLSITSPSNSGKLYLWLDTLCCPVKSRYHRAQCLVLMRQIYREASHVLVLDAQLSEYDSMQIDSLEICARLLFSVWSTRLWTLQEGALARRGGLWIQLRDRAVNTEVLGEELIRRYGTHFLDGHLTLVLLSSLARLRRFVDAGDTGYSAANLVDLRMAVKTRSVSVAADEPLCLATCMGLDQTNVVQATPEHRMKEFWISMRKSGKEIPSNILFFYGDRLNDPGFRWAPVSFLERVVLNKFWLPRRPQEVGVMTDIGLQVQFPACQIAVPESSHDEWDRILSGLESEIPIRHSSSRWYRIVIGCNVPGPWVTTSVVELLQSNKGRNVVLTATTLDELSFNYEGADLSQAVSGSIVSTTGDGGICFSINTTVVVGLMTEQDAYVHERAWQIAQHPDLQSLAGSTYQDSVEQLVVPGHTQLARLSRFALDKILRAADSMMEDAALVRSLRSARSPNDKREYFAECILRFLGGWYGQIERTWHESPQWFAD